MRIVRYLRIYDCYSPEDLIRKRNALIVYCFKREVSNQFNLLIKELNPKGSCEVSVSNFGSLIFNVKNCDHLRDKVIDLIDAQILDGIFENFGNGDEIYEESVNIISWND